MQKEELIKNFKKEKSILNGHFVLSSGLHTDTYIQCARAISNTKLAQKIGRNLSDKIISAIPEQKIDLIVSPAMGGVVIGYEVARNMEKYAIFCERVNGNFTFRRGFEIKENSNIVIIEDVVTSGKSSLETINVIKENFSANILAVGCIFNRGKKDNLDNTPIISLAKIAIETYDEYNLPKNLKNIPVTKPGSRWLKQ